MLLSEFGRHFIATDISIGNDGYIFAIIRRLQSECQASMPTATYISIGNGGYIFAVIRRFQSDCQASMPTVIDISINNSDYAETVKETLKLKHK